MSIKSVGVTSLAELVKAVLDIRGALPNEAFLWFRGLGCDAQYRLLPKIMREGKGHEQVFEREARLLTRFRQRSLAYWPAGYPQNDWEQLFAMQHYGLPTRLLDWSENLFVAAYFALADAPLHPHEGDVCTPCIWCIDPVRWNRHMPGPSEYGQQMHVLTTADEHLEPYGPITIRKRYRSPVAIFGSHNSQRIVAQRGTFVVWGNDPKPLEDFANADGLPDLLWRITLTAPRKNLYRDLQSLGFGESMIFPELPSLATELARTEGWRE
jgi:hypothetical protein